MNFFEHGCCRYDGFKQGWKHHGYQTLDQCQKLCTQDPKCIANDVNRYDQKRKKWDCYTWYGAGVNFHTECHSGDDMCFKKEMPQCESHPCKNGGTCFQSDETGFFCACPSHCHGQMCENCTTARISLKRGYPTLMFFEFRKIRDFISN